MALNRRARRARKDRRPHAGDTPAQQMRDFLRAPGKLHIVQLPGEKSFIVKVTEREMPLFLTICGQLKAVLGHCEAIPATAVDASVADANTIARQTANDPQRLKIAQERQNAAEQARAAAAAGKEAATEFATEFADPGHAEDADEIADAMSRHPAGKQRGRHAKPETAFDLLTQAGGQLDDADTKARIAAIELAEAQDASAKAQEALDAANARLAEVYERAGEIHNQRVLDQFTDAAGQAIADKAEKFATGGPVLYEARATEGPGSEPIWPQYDISGPGKMTIDDGPAYVPGEDFTVSEPEPFIPRVCCESKIGEPHVSGCKFEPREDNPIDYNGPARVETAHGGGGGRVRVIQAPGGAGGSMHGPTFIPAPKPPHEMTCPKPDCDWRATDRSAAQLAFAYAAHIANDHADDGNT